LFKWGKFTAIKEEFKSEKSFVITDSEDPNCGPLTVYAKMQKCKEAGLLITMFVKNVVINNTD